MSTQAVSSPILRFDAPRLKDDLAKARDNVSAVVLHGQHLWLGGDEGMSIDRMTRDPSGHFGNQVRFELKDLLKLEATEGEIDIEGLDVDGGYLWVIGSHSAKRKKAERDKTPAKNIGRLGTIEIGRNRFTLGRIPLTADGEPVAAHGSLSVAHLERLRENETDEAKRKSERGNLLTAALEQDDHLGRFVPPRASADTSHGIPSKDNGFDVEGLAVTGNRVFFGLRGPVLRGWAIVIELRVSASGELLTLDPIGPEGKPYIKHFLQLDGLGVRELVIHGNDLLVLAGPSMDLDGPVYIYQWPGALQVAAESLTWGENLTRVVTVPFGDGFDHAEGLTIATDDPLTVLVSYDSPQPLRIDGEDGSGVKVDVFPVRSS